MGPRRSVSAPSPAPSVGVRGPRAAEHRPSVNGRGIVTAVYDRIAAYYDWAVGDFDADVHLYAQFARRTDRPVLELAVGTGRVAVPLAAEGFAVTGVDTSAAMLEVARSKAAAAGVNLRLEQADLCGYRFVERFGLIVCAADSFMHLLAQERQIVALRRAGEHLALDGLLVLDLPAITTGRWGDWEPGVRPLELVRSGTGPNGTAIQHFQTFTADPTTQRRIVTHIFDETGDDGTVRRTSVSYDLRFVFPGELPLLAEAGGLRVDALYGGYELEPFESGCERMIAILSAAPAPTPKRQPPTPAGG
jgi:SAM-dependent methyltransferase